MKRTERHHLKENEVRLLTRQARALMEARKRETAALLIAIAAIVALAAGYYAWHDRVQSRAHEMLAAAIAVQDARVTPAAPPGGTAVVQPGSYPNERARAEAALVKFKATADAYPSTDAGIFARFQEATILMSFGRSTDAVSRYEEVIKRAGDGIYGQTARLGLAQAQARAGQYDRAINALKELAQRKDGPLPVDGILMQLGQTYLEAGKHADAQQTFNRLVDEYPNSPFTPEAKQQLDSLKKT
jgi:TolA-binding protein